MWPHSSRTHLPPHPWNRREVGRAQPLKEWHGHFVVDLVACHDSCFPMECCPPSSSGHEISQARILVVVHLLGCVWLFMTPWTAACPASLSFTISRSLLKLMPIVSMMPSNHLILCHPPFLLPSIFPSIRVFSNELAPRIRWPKYWSFSISLSNEYSGLISFRFDWLDLLAVQGTHKRVFSNTTVQKYQFFSRIPEWAAISFCRGSSQHRDTICVSCVAGRFFTTEQPGKP